MASRYILSRPVSKRVMAPSPVPSPALLAPAISHPPMTNVVRFRDIETLHVYSRGWETTAKIVSGRIQVNKARYAIYRLADLSGDKMEAVAYGLQAYRFNNDLQIGEVYLLRGVGFQTAETPPQFGLAISTDYYVEMYSRTQIQLAGPSICIPRLPSRFMEFSDAARLRNKMLTDVIGIVVHVGPIRFHKSFDRSTPCRDVVLMNIRQEFICLRIWDRHVSRHMTKWRRAEQDMCILAAVLLEVSTPQGPWREVNGDPVAEASSPESDGAAMWQARTAHHELFCMPIVSISKGPARLTKSDVCCEIDS